MATKTSSVYMTSNTERANMLAAALASSTSTPDYHLPWPGETVEDAIRKMIEFDPNSTGGVITLKSTAETPANLDTVKDPGCYTAKYVTATNLPEDVQNVVPVNMVVTTSDGILYQVIEALGNKWVRFSKDNGETWSVFSPKSTNSGEIDTSGDGTTPEKDPMVNITTQVELFQTSGARIGTEEMATAMMEGKYDYDTGTIVT